jgi:hypothetical protein
MKRNSMAQALSQAAGHSYSRSPVADLPAAQCPIALAAQGTRSLQSVPPSRVGKKPVTGFFNPEVSRQLKQVALNEDKTMQELLQEALNDLFRKYDLPPIA